MWRFDTASGAHEAAAGLSHLLAQQSFTVVDAATVSWAKDARRPTIQSLPPTPQTGALAGAFWGLLFGLVFFVPLLGAALGTPVGELTGSLADVGIDDTFVNKMRDQVTPGTSALFVLTTDDVTDGINEALAPHEPSALVFTHLTEEQTAALREVFVND
jgi:uncharacterized membrane protein